MAAPVFGESSLDVEAGGRRDKLFNLVMKGDWDSVIGQYTVDPLSHSHRITWLGDTALHVAVVNGLEDVAKSLLAILNSSKETQRELLRSDTEEVLEHAGWMGSESILRIQNYEGNTPLHIAASIGSAALCWEMVQNGPTLLGVRNKKGETPLFLAAHQGHTDAFLCLSETDCSRKGVSECCIRYSDGCTALHSAIAGQYFELVGRVNQDGDTRLKSLARRPSAFGSGSKFGAWEAFIHKCIYVRPLEPATTYSKNVIRSNPNDEEQNQLISWSARLRFLRDIAVNLKAQACGRSKPDPEIPTLKDDTGRTRVKRIKQLREYHKWSVQLMNILIENSTDLYAHDKGGEWSGETDPRIFELPLESDPDPAKKDKIMQTSMTRNKETAILIAARNGITEMVSAILGEFPVAVHELDAEKKNVVLLAVESRNVELYRMLLEFYSPSTVRSQKEEDSRFNEEEQRLDHLHVMDNAFRLVDSKGNSALHLAANLAENQQEPWPIPGAALQMQWEIKWHKFIENSMPPKFFVPYNTEGETPEDIFTKSHKNLVKEGVTWLTNTSQSCSVVAALIATVAFATSTAIPGGINDRNGKPNLENQFAFKMFGLTSLVSLCFSVTSLSMFLSILTSRYRENDFGRSLPWKLLLGLTSLFVSIASVLISFCSGHFLVLGDTLKYAAFPVYAITCLPISFFAAAQFPLYFDLIRATFRSPFAGSSSRSAKKYKKKRQVEKVPLKEVPHNE